MKQLRPLFKLFALLAVAFLNGLVLRLLINSELPITLILTGSLLCVIIAVVIIAQLVTIKPSKNNNKTPNPSEKP